MAIKNGSGFNVSGLVAVASPEDQARVAENAAKTARHKELTDKKASGVELTPEEQAELTGINGSGALSQFSSGFQMPGLTELQYPRPGSTGPKQDWGKPPEGAELTLTQLRDKFFAERGTANQPAPTSDKAASNEVRDLQLGQVRQLQDVVSGKTPSVADAQRQAALLDSNQNIRSLAAGATGADGGGARRMAARTTSDNARRIGLDSALVKANEVSQAHGQIGNLLTGTRAGDTGLAIADLTAGVQNRGQNTDLSLGLGELGLKAQTTESETRLREAQIRNLREQLDYAYAQLAAAKDEASKSFWGRLATATIGALAQFGVAYATGGTSLAATAATSLATTAKDDDDKDGGIVL